MGCKNCGHKILHIRTGKRSPVKYSGKTAYFVTKKDYGEMSVAANKQVYVFFEGNPKEAPIEFQKFHFLQMVPKPVSINSTSSTKSSTDLSVEKTETGKKKDSK